MKRVIIFISLASVLFSSCYFFVPHRAKKEFKYCFTGEKTGLDTLININGYYAPSPDTMQWNGRTLINDTLSPAYVFYDNGFVFRTTGMDRFIEKKRISFLMLAAPGGYVLHGDTIKFQVLGTPAGQSREMVEFWFKIVNRNTLQRIGINEKPLPPASERIYIFRPLEIKINPEDTWIYNKRWFRYN